MPNAIAARNKKSRMMMRAMTSFSFIVAAYARWFEDKSCRRKANFELEGTRWNVARSGRSGEARFVGPSRNWNAASRASRESHV